jgi:hypothetical protein
MLRAAVALSVWLATSASAAWHFTDVTTEAGLVYQHGYADPGFDEAADNAGGVAAGDYDRDGFVDLYVVRGDVGPNLLFRNRGDGTFEERGASAGLALGAVPTSGPLFADLDGDGWLDLVVGGISGTATQVYRNRGDGTFEDVTAASGLVVPDGRSTFGATAADYDGDGDVDLFLAHWSSSFFNVFDTSSYHLWQNQGGGTFVDVTLAAGIVPMAVTDNFDSFTGNFVDIDGDGDLDLLVAADFLSSRIYRNDGDGTFTDVTDRGVITDGNGMGAAIGDYDEDGDFDWFVTSIWDPNGISEGFWDTSGNRLYRNRGDGTFEDATDAAGVRVGYWGWGATFQDFDDDGHLDLYHVNGWGDAAIVQTAEFVADPARLYVGNGRGAFVEQAATRGVADTAEGRGVVAFDFDRDGDLDLFVASNGGAPHLYRNDEVPGRGITLLLRGLAPNTEAIGAIVDVQSGTTTKRRLVRAGSNFVSQDPTDMHVGLGDEAAAAATEVHWPGGAAMTTLGPAPAGATLVVNQIAPNAPACRGSSEDACDPGGLKRKVDCLLEWKLPGVLQGGKASAIRKVSCTEGDPRCDVDADTTNGECHVRLGMCTNVVDPRVRDCAPAPLASVTVEEPATDASTGSNLANRNGLLGTLRPLGLGIAGFANPTPNLCLPSTDVTVALRRLRSGRVRPGRTRIRVRAVTTGGLEDADTIVLRCRPSGGRTRPAQTRR